MRIRFRCGCGLVNYDVNSWTCHWKYGSKGKLHAVKLFLLTKVELVK